MVLSIQGSRKGASFRTHTLHLLARRPGLSLTSSIRPAKSARWDSHRAAATGNMGCVVTIGVTLDAPLGSSMSARTAEINNNKTQGWDTPQSSGNQRLGVVRYHKGHI